MIKVAIVGGRLQGCEAAYLARKAGWESIVVDRCPNAPAFSLADASACLDIEDEAGLDRVFGDVQLVIPCLEDSLVLERLSRYCSARGLPFAWDGRAYGVSSSKLISDRLFASLNLTAPRYWPDCSFPIIAKPVYGSGSRQVAVLHNPDEFRAFMEVRDIADWVIQEFVEGPSFSIEVIGADGAYCVPRVTDLAMDARYDCKRVVAPTTLPAELVGEFRDIGLKIAQAIQLRGLMDVEVILDKQRLYLLEIDARLPSQTPTAVFWTSGLNILTLWADIYMGKFHPGVSSVYPGPNGGDRGVVYEHIRVSPGLLEVCGEHIMAEASPLHVRSGFFGADEALTDFSPEATHWVATLIHSGADPTEAWKKREQTIKTLRERFNLERYEDPEPELARPGAFRPLLARRPEKR